MGKRAYLYEELGEGTVELMKTIKNAIDPYNLFNPGKVSCVSLYAGRKAGILMFDVSYTRKSAMAQNVATEGTGRTMCSMYTQAMS